MNEALSKAIELNRNSVLKDIFPIVDIGDICTIDDIWDGNGDEPNGSYSYKVTDDGLDGNSNYPVWINYVFDRLDNGKIKIVDIELV